MSFRSILSIVLFRSIVSFLIFCLDYLSSVENGLSKLTLIIVFLFISHLGSSSICFIYLGVLMLGSLIFGKGKK